MGFTTVDQLPDRLRDVDFPIALGLPFWFHQWEQAIHRFDEMLAVLKEAQAARRLIIPAIHATQSRMTDEAFFEVGCRTLRLAECVGANSVTVHPDWGRKNRAFRQEAAIANLRRLAEEAPIAVSIETFEGGNHLFKPEEIIEAKLPMTLDTAHISDHRRLMTIVDTYWRRIPVVHLSARKGKEHHLPVDQCCIRVVQRLVELRWSGTIALEYQRSFRARLQADVRLVERALRRQIP